jgi:hypothetical protein
LFKNSVLLGSYKTPKNIIDKMPFLQNKKNDNLTIENYKTFSQLKNEKEIEYGYF